MTQALYNSLCLVGTGLKNCYDCDVIMTTCATESEKQTSTSEYEQGSAFNLTDSRSLCGRYVKFITDSLVRMRLQVQPVELNF